MALVKTIGRSFRELLVEDFVRLTLESSMESILAYAAESRCCRLRCVTLQKGCQNGAAVSVMTRSDDFLFDIYRVQRQGFPPDEYLRAALLHVARTADEKLANEKVEITASDVGFLFAVPTEDVAFMDQHQDLVLAELETSRRERRPFRVPLAVES